MFYLKSSNYKTCLHVKNDDLSYKFLNISKEIFIFSVRNGNIL